MVVLSSQTSVLGISPGELRLRVSRGNDQGQSVALTHGKCTIGSSPNSTLHLVARGVEPCHCLILRGQHGTVVRSWSKSTRLNGRRFDDAQLMSGDRISCGPIEVEVLPAGSGIGDDAINRPADRSAGKAKPRSGKAHRRTKRLVAEVRRLRQRLAEMTALATDNDQALEEITAREAAIAVQRVALDASREALADGRAQLAEEQARLQAERETNRRLGHELQEQRQRIERQLAAAEDGADDSARTPGSRGTTNVGTSWPGGKLSWSAGWPTWPRRARPIRPSGPRPWGRLPPGRPSSIG